MKLPKVRMLKKQLYWMHERQRIYLKRLSGEPWPWTQDPILRSFRFCCVYRENDKVTQWIRDNWRIPYADHPNLWFAMCVARQINWPDTLAEIGFPEDWNPRRVLRILEKRKRSGKKIYSGAYILGGGNPDGVSKIRYTVMGILNPLWRWAKSRSSTQRFPWETEEAPTLKATFDWLLSFHGFGRFLAYEVVTDLRHTRCLCNASDINTWANIGPGAQRGLNRLYERDVRKSHPQSQLLEELLAVYEWIRDRRDAVLLPTLELRDMEHVQCECEKYWRAEERLREGRMVGLERFVPPGLLRA